MSEGAHGAAVAEAGSAQKGLRTPSFVGRQEALRALDAALERATRFQTPQFITVVGALGMGKTRLSSEWAEGVRGRGTCRVVRTVAAARAPEECAPEPFSLLAGLLKARFGLTGDLDAQKAQAVFSAELQAVFGDRRVGEVGAFLGRFLGFDAGETPLASALAARPEQELDVARAILCRFFEEDAHTQPLVFVVDGIHLADDRSLELLERLAAEIGEAAFVLVATARPEIVVRRPAWGRGEGSHARVDLGPLSPLEMDVFIRSALETEVLAPGLAERAAIESGGNPFLLGELLRTYHQHGILSAGTVSSWLFDGERAERVTLPHSPELAAHVRLSGLSAAERDVMARGAAFGSLFWTGGVVAVGRLGSDVLDPASAFAPDPAIVEVRKILEDLADRDYLVKLPASIVPGECEWSFCQAAERSLVVAGIAPDLMRRRQQFAAQWIEGRTQAEARPEWHEQLGTLYEEGGDLRRAGLCFLSAGDEAKKCRRHDRARALYLRGVKALDAGDAVVKMDGYFKLGDVTARLGRTREAMAHFTEMLKLAWRLDLPAKGGAAHGRLGRLYRSLGDYKRALQHLEMAHVLFDLAGDRPGIAATMDDMGRIHCIMGNVESSMTFHRAALAVRDELGDEKGSALSLSWMGLVESQGGELPAAERHFRRALDIRRKARDTHGMVFSLLDLGGLEREMGRPDRAQGLLEEARKLSRDMGERLYECHLGIQIGDCLLAQRRPTEAEWEFRAAHGIAIKFSAKRLVAEAARGLGDALLAVGDSLAARDRGCEALDIAEAIGVPALRGAAMRVLAAAVAAGAPEEPERGGPREIFDSAIELLAGAGAELELGRTLVAYADFEESRGRLAVARSLRGRAEQISLGARTRKPPVGAQTTPAPSLGSVSDAMAAAG